MLSKYTFMAPNLIRVSGEGADYAYLITSASPPRILRPLCPPTGLPHQYFLAAIQSYI